MKDANRARLYRAEQAVRRDLASSAKREGTTCGDVTFADTDEAQAWLTAAVGGRTGVTIRQARSKTTSTYRCGIIELSPGWGFTGIVLLHEYAHHLTRGLLGAPSHGGEFARTLLRLLDDTYTSPDVGSLMRAAYEKSGYRWEPDDQVAMARRQVLRARADQSGAGWSDADIVLFDDIIFATDPADFDGATYRLTCGRVSRDSTYGTSGLLCQRLGEYVNYDQLRYVSAPMIRVR